MAQANSPSNLTARKRFIPLESNPTVFTDLIHVLGMSPALSSVDVLSVDDKDLLALVPRPVLALIFVFPSSEEYDRDKKVIKDAREEYVEEEGVVWFEQTIENACGLYAILHACCNGEARRFIEPGSTLFNLLNACISLPPPQRALYLESSEALETAHSEAANSGDSTVPALEYEPDFHYIAFAKSHKDGHLYELNGNCKGPLDKGMLLKDDEDMLGEGALGVVREYLKREEGRNVGFSLMALAKGGE